MAGGVRLVDVIDEIHKTQPGTCVVLFVILQVYKPGSLVGIYLPKRTR